MIGNLNFTEDNHDDIHRMIATMVERLNRNLRVSLTVNTSLEWVKQLYEEYIQIAPELDIHNCSKFLMLRMKEYVLEEAWKQLKDSSKGELIRSELSATQQQIQSLVTVAGLNKK